MSAPPNTQPLPTLSLKRPIHWNSWVAGIVCLVVGVLVPLLNVVTPEKSALHASDFLVTLVGKLTCYGIVAIAMDLVWGYAGSSASAMRCSSPSAVTPWACT